LEALKLRLNDAAANGRPFIALHLDAYLCKDADNGQILVGFEAPHPPSAPVYRNADFVSAAAFASLLATHRLRLVSLSCHSNTACDFALTVGLARALLAVGVAAVITLHPDTPAETQQRFWSGFYQELLHGTRISRAMLAGQRRLTNDSYRAPGLGSNIHLTDWFCCQLYLGDYDPRFCIRPPLELWRRLLKSAWNNPPSRLPPLPKTGFIGRSRTLLILERLIEEKRTLFLRGPNGNGKTTTAVAFAHWLLRCGRFQQVAYVNHDDAKEPNLLLEALGRQLLPDGKRWSIERYANFWEALRHLHQSLVGQSILIVLDQLEHWPSACDEIFQQLWSELLRQDPELRLLGLGRLGPPTFARPWKEITLGAIDEEDGIRLIYQTLIATRELPPTVDNGSGFQPLRDLVKLAGGHPAALQRIASEIAAHGVNSTLALLRPLRTEVLSRHTNDAQWPLFLSLELALRRLPAEDQERLMILAFFKEGVNSIALGKALLLDVQQLEAFSKRLLALELVQDRGYGHLRFDPALSQHLAARLSVSERLLWRERWCSGMEALVEALYQQYFKEKVRTTRLLRLELPNLMALLRDHQQHFSAERNARLASRLEQLTANLGVQSALTEIIAARERSSQALSGWSRMRFEIERLRVERLRENGLIEDAFQAARHLLRQSQDAGLDSYHGADYDLGRAHFQLAKLLKLAGAAQTAINEFTTAHQRFQSLAATGNQSANRMVAVTHAELGDCFLYLQRLPEAAAAYEAAIAHTGPKTFEPVVATNMLQLGVVRQRQGQYSEALALYDGARRMFEGLGDPEGAARSWQQLALARKLNGETTSALHASQQALYLYEQRRNRDGIAETLAELGHLHQVLEQLEQAAAAYRRLSALCAEAGDGLGEEAGRNKLANILLQLQRPDEARQELYRASICNLPDSYTARNWAIRRGLHDFGQMVQNPDIADRARRQAMQKYLAYRKTGGDNDNAGARLCMQVRHAIHTGDIQSLSRKLEQLAINPNIPDIGKLLIAKLQEILAGSRSPTLVADPALHYQYAVELQLLLEDLANR
jgi:tetratricopeptide (TPR) repeat protein